MLLGFEICCVDISRCVLAALLGPADCGLPPEVLGRAPVSSSEFTRILSFFFLMVCSVRRSISVPVAIISCSAARYLLVLQQSRRVQNNGEVGSTVALPKNRTASSGQQR